MTLTYPPLLQSLNFMFVSVLAISVWLRTFARVIVFFGESLLTRLDNFAGFRTWSGFLLRVIDHWVSRSPGLPIDLLSSDAAYFS